MQKAIGIRNEGFYNLYFAVDITESLLFAFFSRQARKAHEQ